MSEQLPTWDLTDLFTAVDTELEALLTATEAFAQMLQSIGFDVASAEFWQGGCDVVRVRLSELQALVG